MLLENFWAKSGSKAFGDYFVVSRRQKTTREKLSLAAKKIQKTVFYKIGYKSVKLF
jgi:hypothetical protein